MLLQLEIPVDAVTYAAKLGFQNNMKVILNPAPAAKLPKKLLYHVDYLTPNEHEAEQLSGVKINGIESAQKAAVKILKSGVKNVIITLGAKGVYCVGSFGSFYQPAFKVKAKDTTAAGDTFNGAFAVAIGRGLSLTEAIKFGCAASAIAVTREGALTSVPDALEIEKFLHASLDQKKLGTHISK
jgi:ribokinase